MPPRLCYIGPAIGGALGGQVLMYKLLSDYPPDRLMLIQTHVDQIAGEHLPAAQVLNLPKPPPWATPRMRTILDLSFFFGSRVWLFWLRRRIDSFRPDAIVSVLHGWASALGCVMSSVFNLPW